MQNLLHTLTEDIHINRAQLQSASTQVSRRNYIRSVFALFDYRLYLLRDATLKLMLQQENPADEEALERIVPLLEEHPRLRDNGRVEPELNRAGFLPLLAYTLKQYAALTGYTKDVLSDNRYNDFRNALALRNRITHPRAGDSLEITDEDLASVEKAAEWWDAVEEELKIKK
jgi:hypothetical protein